MRFTLFLIFVLASIIGFSETQSSSIQSKVTQGNAAQASLIKNRSIDNIQEPNHMTSPHIEGLPDEVLEAYLQANKMSDDIKEHAHPKEASINRVLNLLDIIRLM
ncbi:hypothetical protein Sps_03915 [Shewanella psychrophila]|uniref:Uncharacterized protein n=1 Tax=Shewanella psychrophila TaxID=225848 RepID=A0A1S6HTZ4_9GAMM|nr:hypothetical protein [Shewanella psychrophila]AQS39030.1 hypothetical protein Sps_03915 [Shewanella psychrophila]